MNKPRKNAILLIAFWCYATTLVFGQNNPLDEKVSISFQNSSVQEAFKQLSDATGFTINYASSRADQTQRLTYDYHEARLADIIKTVWGKENIKLEAQGQAIDVLIIKPPKKGNVKGRIINTNNEPIPFATVGIKSTDKGTVTDEQGKFVLNDIVEGAYILSVLSTGYEPKELRVKVLPEQTSTIDIALTVEVTELNEVVILGENAEVQQLLLSAKAIAVIDTEQAKIQTIDLGEVLTRTQGVNVQRSGGLGSNAQLSLNGLTNDQIRFFVDGVPLRSMGYVFGLANVPVNLVDRVEVYKGVVPVRFGADALGGAVNLVSNQAFEGTGGTISYQVGSFNTHRLAFNGYHQPQNGNYFIKASGFYDYTQNNYDIDVEVPDARGKLTEQTIERFHDDYLARGLNVDFGLRNLTWADELMIKGFMSDGERDLQHNFIMSIPYGEVTTDYASLGGLLRWRKNFGQGLSIENVAGLSENQTELLDTASFVYTWEGTPSVNLDGDIILRDPPGERGVPSDIQFVDRTYYNRFNLDLRLGNYHQLRFSSSPTFDSRSGRNFLITDPETVDRFTLRNEILTFTNGVEYEYKRSDKINIIAFFKSYTQNLNTQDIENGGLLTDVERRTNDLGYGANLKYSVSNRLELKTSYEWATRLPNVQEVFGDGVFISDNVDLEPERSHNINLALNYKTRFFGNSNIGLGVNGFVRDVRNLIVLLGADEVFVYQNVADASSRGVELNMSWSSYDRNINFVANSTYFDFVNTAESGPFAAFNGDRIPNRPYLFFNSSLRYRFDQLFEDPNDLIVFAGSRYVHDFFRSWESAGRQDTKQVIPGQFTQNIGVTHNRSFSNKRLALTLEVQNLTDAKVFDLFGVQRPGRAYYFKTIFTF